MLFDSAALSLLIKCEYLAKALDFSMGDGYNNNQI